MRSILLLLLSTTPSLAGDPLHRHPTIQAMLQENNRIRIEEKLKPHVISPVLTNAAQDQAAYMARTHDFEHITIDNGSPGVRAARYGYSGTVRENLGRAQKSISQVFVKWKQSPTHWESIVGGFVESGFGYAVSDDGTEYWVALYGTSRKDQWEHVRNHQEEAPPNSRDLEKSIRSFLLISL